ncbi:RimK/LysX family protein [Cobetia marina]|uniref:RimK/LysX family protein n=1 Tax=Cobetia marina TaxID=28258 RepID=A0ABU9GDG3_COBMA
MSRHAATFLSRSLSRSLSRVTRQFAGAAGLGLIASLALPTAAQAEEDKVFGWVEKATIEPWGVLVKAKLDSGALTSSMHAENIETFTRDDEEWVRFDVEVEDEASGGMVENSFERPLYRDLTVSGAGGRDTRPVVLMTLCMGGERYEEQFSLRDRDGMNYPVLLGRRTIQSLGVLDVRKTFQTTPDCGEDAPLHRYEDKQYSERIGAAS